MDLGLRDKVIIITGGGSGIGEAIAKMINQEGGFPVIIDRDENNAKRVGNEILETGGKIHTISTSLNNPENCNLAIKETLDITGRIDGLVNNAGINDGIGLEHGTPSKYLQSLENNLHHYYYMAHFAIAALKETAGSIVNISSKCAVTGQGGTSAYAAAKGAQLAMTREWAVELLPYQIRVNAILPAEVKTQMYDRWLDGFSDREEKLKQIQNRIPLGNRRTSAEEIASTTLFLLSDQASHITGQHIYVDGGYVHLDRALAGLSKNPNEP